MNCNWGQKNPSSAQLNRTNGSLILNYVILFMFRPVYDTRRSYFNSITFQLKNDSELEEIPKRHDGDLFVITTLVITRDLLASDLFLRFFTDYYCLRTVILFHFAFLWRDGSILLVFSRSVAKIEELHAQKFRWRNCFVD